MTLDADRIQRSLGWPTSRSGEWLDRFPATWWRNRGFSVKFTKKNDYKRLLPWLSRINRLAPEMSRLSDSELAAKTPAFRKRYQAGETIDALLPEAFAVVREAAWRVLGERHEDVQIIGGVALYFGKIAEMATGEGKTLTAVPPAYLNALSGHKVHVITFNDYLAKRDRFWMGKIYEFLGLRVGLIESPSPHAERRKAYEADITYGSSSEFVFDYLRDYWCKSQDKGFIFNYLQGETQFVQDRCCQKELHYAIVDEIDSILIDSGTSPLSISDRVGTPPIIHVRAIETARGLTRDVHFSIDEKKKRVEIFPEKIERDVELPAELKRLGKEQWKSYVMESLRALWVLEKDRDYILQEGKIVLVDPFTGRAAPQRSFGAGLHQAIQVKEKVAVTPESRPSLSTSYALYFNHYSKLAGMTGTAASEAKEFKKIFGLGVVTIPTHRPLQRHFHPDVIYRTEKEKVDAVIDAIENCQKTRRPVLVGTNSVQKCELLSEALHSRNIEHHVLSARHHEKEAEIIAQAGHAGRVTVVTNMAGRGVDIVLGEGVAELGGLHVIATEHHDAKRIDAQLYGRAGRRGDPGSATVFASLEDDLLRVYRRKKRIQKLFKNLAEKKSEAGKPIHSRKVERLMERAQKFIQKYHFQLRKQLMKRATMIRNWRESDRYDPFLEKWEHFVF